MATPHESPPPFPQKPVRAGQYYLLEKIAQGGMAEIYKGLAYDLAGIKKTVCIKKILPHIAASREFIDMLVDEAKIAVQLSQGNIAQVYDLGKAGEDYFIVMEFVEGQSLSKIFKKA
ncbi:MAG: protein kinase, partial [Deltaproteobacteria bacterium]|nr:protein kinase [Deltaproteobacteria bacterium]